MKVIPILVLVCSVAFASAGEPVATAAALVAAVRDAKEGDVVELAPGVFELEAPLDLKGKMTLKGAGIDKSILTGAKGRVHSTKSLPDPEMTPNGLDTDAYLVRIKRDTDGVTLSDMTLRGTGLHGAIYAWFHTGLHLHHLRIEDTLSSGLRTFGMTKAKIHDCEFIDAGGRWDGGRPGVKGGLTGGGIFAVWMRDCEISDNRFVRKNMAPEREFYGIKVRQGVGCRVHHNTIETNFSMEFPFENDEDNEIDHNVCHGTVSLPKHAGGVVPASGKTFHIHHNWFKDSYTVEFVRNGVEIDHNLFDFPTDADHGNLISSFGDVDAKGPAKFHDNLVNNPGRGVVWINEVFNNLEVRNNHIICRKTITPRTEGLFGLNSKCDFKTIVIKDNVVECLELSRPLLRADESYAAVIENNRLTNVADAMKLKNEKADRPVGLTAPLKFECGAKGEYTVDGWNAGPTKR
ncbi:MAG: right-handed parallel beta-helix repeat-containing protein [Planctomycetia bacterium]